MEYLKDRVVGLDTAARRVNEVVLESGADFTPMSLSTRQTAGHPTSAHGRDEDTGRSVRRMCFYYDCQTAIEDLPLMRHVSAETAFRPEAAVI